MISSRHSPGSRLRARALLAAFLVYAFGLLPFLAASHTHAEDAAHSSCQLCQVSTQPCQAPTPALAPLPPAAVSFLPPEVSPRAIGALPTPYESRGPPSA